MEENISNILLLFSFLMTSLSARNAFITSFSMSRVVPSKPFVVCSCDRRDYSLNHGSLVLKVFFYPLPCDFYLLGLTMLLVLVLIYSPNKCIKHQLIFNLTSMISLQALLAVGYQFLLVSCMDETMLFGFVTIYHTSLNRKSQKNYQFVFQLVVFSYCLDLAWMN